MAKINISMLKHFDYLKDIFKNSDVFTKYYIDGSRKSGKTKAVVLMLVLHIINTPKLDVFAFRKSQNKIEDSIHNEFLWAMNVLNVKNLFTYSASKKTFTCILNDNNIKMKGLYTANGKYNAMTGIASNRPLDYIISWFEEAFEYSLGEFLDVSEALRGATLIEIRTSNPWRMSSPYVQELNKLLPYDEEFVKKKENKHQQLLWDKHKGILVHHLAYLSNPLMLESDRLRLEREAILYPHRAKTSLWGNPGTLQGGVYVDIMGIILEKEKSRDQLLDEHVWTEFAIGVDFAERRDATAAVFIGDTYEYSETYAFEYYYHKNNQNDLEAPIKDIYTQAKELITFAYECYIEYKVHERTGEPLYMGVDNTASQLINALRKEIINRELEEQIRIIHSPKIPINKRIDMTIAATISNKFRLVTDKRQQILHLLKEMESSSWDDLRGDKRVDGNDDAINALEYALSLRWHSRWNDIRY